jgi:membrane fusion protein, multidrug efflux system
VQRVPVRVALDANEVAKNPLRVGLSMDAEVDVSNQEGKTLADAPRSSPVAQTQVFSSVDNGADAEVRRVIVANAGRGAGGTALASARSPSSVPAQAIAKTAASAAASSSVH